MSTRAQITIGGEDVKLYVHSDGYPSGILPTLLPFLRHFFKHRGWDPKYMAARMTVAFATSLDEDAEEFSARMVEKAPPEIVVSLQATAATSRLLGLGLDTVWHDDIEYAYVVHENEEVWIYSGCPADVTGDPIGRIPINMSIDEAVQICMKAEENDE